MQHYMPLVKKCYEAANFRSPNLRGHLFAGMTVAADGTVSNSWTLGPTVGGADGYAELEDCLGRTLCEVVFPKPKTNGGGVFYQSFYFGAGKIGMTSSRTCYGGHVSTSGRASEPARPVPKADAGAAEASASTDRSRGGSLDKEVIRSVIRAHGTAVRTCYEKGLSRNLDLQGRISYQFTIAADGTVITAMVQSSTMNDVTVEDCLGQEICTWEFPRPIGGGIVIVSYPFNFTHG
jgi:hypothetical protein